MSSPDPQIRRAARHEIAAIEDLTVLAYAQYRAEIPAAVFDAYVEDLRSLALYWSTAEVLVADVDGRIAGAVQFYADAGSEGLGLPQHWAGFRKLAVDPGCRGAGLGRVLMEACIARARSQGAAAVGIHTASFMTAARALYERRGFRRCPEYDARAGRMLALGEGDGDVAMLAYRLDLAGT